MIYVSTKQAPAFKAHITLQQEGNNYRFLKNTIEQERYNELINQEECHAYLNGEHRVCVKMNDNYRLYNFQV